MTEVSDEAGEYVELIVAVDSAKRELDEAIVENVSEERMRVLYRKYLDLLARKKALTFIEPSVKFRGSVSDLVTDLSALLTVEQLQELAGEAACEWRRRRQGKPVRGHRAGCSAQRGGFGVCDCTVFEESEG